MRSISEWKGKAVFEHRSEGGVPYVTDARANLWEDSGTKGPAPMELFLGGLGGCTGVDIVFILTKMRIDVRSLRITVDADRAPEHPKVYTKVHVLYEIETDPVHEKKVLRAVELSSGRYCSASAILAAVADVTYTLAYNGKTFHGRVPLPPQARERVAAEDEGGGDPP